VIFTADDFGLDLAVNEAVETAHREGVLTSASLMVGAQHAEDAVDRARRLPELAVGLHLTLVEGTPVLPPELVPDLVDQEGQFSNDMVRAGFKFFFLPRVRRQLEREITAQFESFGRTGLRLDHANAHKHFHLHPTVASLILKIGRRFGLRGVRIPYEPPQPLAAVGETDSIGARAMRLWTWQLRNAVRRAGLCCNDNVFGLAWSGQMTEQRLVRLLPHLPDGLSEIYLHPASHRTETLARTMPDYRPDEELAALVSPGLRRALTDAGIETTSFSRVLECAA
jgi:hopanoid biosynthesis associated protein HpnK